MSVNLQLFIFILFFFLSAGGGALAFAIFKLERVFLHEIVLTRFYTFSLKSKEIKKKTGYPTFL